MLHSSPSNQSSPAIASSLPAADTMVSQKLLTIALEREKYYQSLLASMPLAAYACDKTGHITFFNEAAVQLWGYRPDTSHPLLKYCACYKVFVDGHLIMPQQTPMAMALETGQSFRNVEAVVERPDGSTFYASVNINPLFDEQHQVTGAINIFQDISDSIQAKHVLQQSESNYRVQNIQLEELVSEQSIHLQHKTGELKQTEAFYHKMVEEVEDYAIILLDKDGIIRNWNRGAENIKGYKEGDIVGKSFQLFYLPADRASGLPLQLLEKARVTGKAAHEGWRLRKDGSAFWGSILLTALHNDQQEVIGFSKVTRDLTERKLAEDKLREYLGELEFQNKELEQFVYACSHDIKEPLRKILFYNSLVVEHSSSALDEKAQLYLNRSVEAGKRMKKLIDDLLTYSLNTSRTGAFGKVDLNEIVAEIMEGLKEEIEAKQVGIVVKNPLPVLQGISFQLSQLLYNLVQNSIKYKHPERAARIEISSEVVQGDSNRTTAGFYHKIAVADNGLGFEPDNATKIFKLFHRLQPTSGQSGSGIGLAICKKIVQNHKGMILAEGIPGTGATFTIYFPL
jgi:PAS domain S-box-containing protein